MICSRTAWRGSAIYRQHRGFSTTCKRLKTPFNILFCGSDKFSIGSLTAVLKAKGATRTKGRGGKNTKRPKEAYRCDLLTFAEQHGLDHSTLSSVITADESERKDASWNVPPPFDKLAGNNLLLTASFGHIIPNNLLHRFNLAHRLNVHPSMLPKYRGAAPVQWTILNGDQTTGISVQRLVEKGKGIDAGEIVGSVSDLPVPFDATFSNMIDDLAPKGGELLVQCLRDTLSGRARPQDSALKTRAPKISKEMTRVDWTIHSAVQVDRMQRAISHQHPLWVESRQTLQLIEVSPLDQTSAKETLEQLFSATIPDFSAGTALLDRTTASKSRRMLVACTSGEHADNGIVSWLEVTKVKPEGRKEMSVKDWWNGLPDEERREGRIQL